MVDLASRRGVFGWIAGLLAAPAAARSVEPAQMMAKQNGLLIDLRELRELRSEMADISEAVAALNRRAACKYERVAHAPDNGEFRYVIRNAADKFEVGHAVFRGGSCINRMVIEQAEGEPTLTSLTVFPSLVDMRAGDRLWIMQVAP